MQSEYNESEFVELLESLSAGNPLSPEGREMLEQVASPSPNPDLRHNQLNRVIRELVEELTDREVWNSHEAALALLER